MMALRRAGLRPPTASIETSTTPRGSGRVVRFPVNDLGRDFVVGDIHGCFDQVVQGLKAVGFDRRRDRLFSLGDTVDRGPGSPRAAGFLAQNWIHAIRGNHEDMFLEMYDNGEPHPAVIEYVTSHNGMSWWRDLPEGDRQVLIERFRALPIVIEIETRRGVVGLVHAEVPSGMDWRTFTSRIEAGDAELVRHALWERGRLDDDTGVQGIDRVFVGHTPQDRPTRRGNVYYIDTGAVFGVVNESPEKGRLTFADVACRTMVFSRPPSEGFVDLRVDDLDAEVVTTPFGNYSR